jgi:hypothetical protein
MNETVQLGTLPRSKLPTTTYEKALSYFESLAELHLLHLGCQRNEANIPADVDPYVVADDFRRKFVVRFLFRKVVRNQKQRKQWIFDDDGPFPVWCDDFRPENVLVDEAECIAGVIDWEFTYAAPVEFSYASPWWFLLQKPENWRKGFDDLRTEYEKALQTLGPGGNVEMRRRSNSEVQKKLLVESQQ